MLKEFGDLEVGDVILGPNNEEVEVSQVYDEHIPEKMFEIVLDDGSMIKASGNHLWYVETDLDYSCHGLRRKTGKKFFGSLSDEIIDNLVSIAESDDYIETGLIDMVSLCEVEDNDLAIGCLTRIAASIGHVAENKQEYKDFLTNEVFKKGDTIRSYDAKVFAQQILSLTGKRKYKKKYPLRVGKVVTTEFLVDNMSDVDIPVLEQKE